MKYYFSLVLFSAVCVVTSCKNDRIPSRNDIRKCDTETNTKQAFFDSINRVYPKYMVAGMYQEKDWQRQQVDALYGFRFSIEAGCVVSDSLGKVIEINNQKTDSILSKRHGKNWYKRFEKSVDSLYHLDTTAYFIASNNPQVTHFLRRKRKDADTRGFDHNVLQTELKDVRMVQFFRYSESSENPFLNTAKSFVRVYVNTSNSQLISMDTIVWHGLHY